MTRKETEMDTWAFGIIGVSTLLYFVSKKNVTFLFTLGVGCGLLVGALWAAAIIAGVLR